MSKTAVVAFGGNAILKSNQRGLLSEQIRNSDEACRAILPILEHGYEMVIVHGNGPQVGNVLIQVEEAVTKIPPVTLDVCVAQTQGSMAYMLEKSLLKQLNMRGIAKEVACVMTQVIVDADDPGFRNPTKPIGPFYTEYRAHELMRREKWKMVEDSGRGYRKIVASPKPHEIVSLNVVRRLIRDGYIVIAAGGGGIPVARDKQGFLYGVEAVIDKDYAASLLATEIGADFLLILTGVDQVFINYGKPDQQPLAELSVEDARQYLNEGQFAPGSMGPKMDAAIEYIERGGREVLVTSARKLQSALMGRTGTRIFHGQRRLEKMNLQKTLPFTPEPDA